jgi:tRNA (Thr-GGU) A37 N-methylase
MEIQCTSIGTVSHEGGYSLLIEHAYRKGLVGLEGFGHVQVL